MTRRQQFCRIASSGLISIGIVLLCYFAEAVPFTMFEAFWKYFVVERLIQRTVGHEEDLQDGLFIDVGYDKAVAETSLYNGLFTGKVAITDRATLDDLLRRLQEEDTYKYVFLDVRFEKGIETPEDSVLFNRISKMRDIVVATHYGMDLASPLLEDKAALSDYKMFASSTGFSRYMFLQNDRETVPLRIYQDLTGNTIKQVLGIFVFRSEHSFCKNTLFLRIPYDFSTSLSDSDKMNYYHCGPQIDDSFPLGDLARERYVFIGDYVNDLSGTYRGEQPNPYITYLATKSLMRGNHLLSCWLILILFVVFWGLSYLALLGQEPSIVLSICSARGKKLKPFWKWALSFLSYSIDLSILCIITFLLFHSTFSIIVSSTILTIVSNTRKVYLECHDKN